MEKKMNLQYFAENVNVTTDAGLSVENKTFYDRALLEEMLRTRPENTELVLTGRNAPETLTSAAHYVTEMKKIKHPYDCGIPAREGIEF